MSAEQQQLATGDDAGEKQQPERLRATRIRDEEFCQAAAVGDLKKLSKYISEIGQPRPETDSGAAAATAAAAASAGTARYPMLEDINCSDALGRTALMRAAEAGHYEAVKLLIANGSDVNKQDWNGVTALHLAAKMHHLRVVKFLVMSEARLDACTRSGLAPVDLANYNSDTWSVLHLAAAGTMPTVDHLVQTIEVPLVPAYAIPTKPKSADGKKGKKKGKKGAKKGGKKKKK